MRCATFLLIGWNLHITWGIYSLPRPLSSFTYCLQTYVESEPQWKIYISLWFGFDTIKWQVTEECFPIFRQIKFTTKIYKSNVSSPVVPIEYTSHYNFWWLYSYTLYLKLMTQKIVFIHIIYRTNNRSK